MPSRAGQPARTQPLLALRKWLFPALAVTFSLFLASGAEGQGKGKNEVATDPAKAGPDYAVQGEYLGSAGEDKLGVEVVALGGSQFQVNFLPGGLRGEGGDYGKRVEGKGHKAPGAIALESKDRKWSALIEGGKMTVKTGDGRDFTLKKVERKSRTLGEPPPPGAVVLFDGKNADEWNNGKVIDGSLLGSDISSKKKFRDHKIHLEFRLSFMPYARGQGRSNSGVYVQQRYEIQVLDSFGLKGQNNECGGVYGQAAPLVNMCYPPLQWQTYDIELRAARFEGGKKVADAQLTVRHNGVLIHDRLALKGPTAGGGKESEAPGALFLQGHGGQVQYRNIWVVQDDKVESR
jgi:hypothetical protein